MTLYTNIKNLCAAHGTDNFWEFAREIYRNTGCGPWLSLVLTEGREVYSGDRGADDPTQLDEPDIIGIRIGSIVEGSDVEVGPKYLRFPFTSEDFEGALTDIHDEAFFYWERDNVQSYEVTSSSGKPYYVDVSPFDKPQAAGEPGSVPSKTLCAFRRWYSYYDGPLEENESVTFKVNPPSSKRMMTITRIEKSHFTY
jgi:hypothetical protein